MLLTFIFKPTLPPLFCDTGAESLDTSFLLCHMTICETLRIGRTTRGRPGVVRERKDTFLPICFLFRPVSALARTADSILQFFVPSLNQPFFILFPQGQQSGWFPITRVQVPVLRGSSSKLPHFNNSNLFHLFSQP